MRNLRSWLLLTVLLPMSLPAAAQSRGDRMYLFFAEDAAVVDSQWWEGRLEADTSDDIDRLIIRGVAAFQPWNQVELGVDVGFGDTDTGFDGGGNGATDLEFWGKYYFGATSNRTEFAAGGIITVPTGDDSVGLGEDAFGLKIFGAMRYSLRSSILAFNLGVQFNGDGRVFDAANLDGQTAPSVGAAWIKPFGETLALTIEAEWAASRFRQTSSDTRLSGGVDWYVSDRGIFRGAVDYGFSDSFPDWRLRAGYAYSF